MALTPELLTSASDTKAETPGSGLIEKNLMLDGLRGLAILLVMGHHIYADFGTNDHDSFLFSVCMKFFKYGYCGVDLFFVLSGYLITIGLLRTSSSKHYYRNFYSKRVLRVWPLYFLTLFIVGISTSAVYKIYPGIFGQLRDWPWLIFFLSNIPMACRHEDVFGNLSHFWSLAIEEQFYAFWPITVRVTKKLLLPTLFVIVAIALVSRAYAIVTNQGHLAAYAHTMCRMDGLAIGAIIATLQGKLINTRMKSAANLTFIGTSLLTLFVLVWLPKFGISYGEDLLAPTMFAITFAALLVMCLQPVHPLHRFLKNPVLRFVGTISFGLYVLHNIFKAPLIPIGGIVELFPNREQTIAVYAAIKYGIAFIVAVVSYKFFEKPLLELKKRLG